MLKKHELLLASRLMSMAAEVFSNHGCNDTPDELFAGISRTEMKKMAEAFEMYNSQGRDEVRAFKHIGDSCWMSYLAFRLTEEATAL